jgi:replicative DNA helicase
MADGLSTISALLREGGRTGVRFLRQELFLPEEQVAYDLLMQHYRQHGELPTHEVFVRAGIQLPQTDTGFGYFLDQLHRRAIHNTSRDIHAQLSDALRTRDTDQMVQLIREAGVQVGGLRAEQTVQTAGRVVGDVIEDYMRVHERAHRRGITMGYEPLDDLTAGAQPGDLIVVLARRGMGKSYDMVRKALAAWNEGNSVLFVTMEMTDIQIVRRMVAMRAGINPDLVRRGVLSGRALARLREVANLFRSQDVAPFWLMPGGFNKSTGDVDALVQEFRPDIVFIDGSYLLHPVKSGLRAKWEVQAQIHEELKLVTAMGRDVPVVCSVQVNRDGARLKKQTDGIAAGSDAIEQIASVMTLIRPGRGQHENDRRRVFLIKNRDGPVGRFQIHFEFEPLNMEWDEHATFEDEVNDAARQEVRNHSANLDRTMR